MTGKIENIIYHGNTLIYIEKNDKHGKPVIIKEPAEEHPPTQEISALENEFNITHLLNIKGVRKAIRKEEKRGLPVLVFEYIHGHTLQDYIHTEASRIDEKLNIAISLSRILEQLHQQNITHNDLTSQNILVGYDDNAIFFIDFGRATINKKNARKISALEFKKNSLPYISPEQTGRINRPIDHRSDLYSLGIIIYELFTGRLPFLSEDPQDLIHKHLAEEPASPCALNPEIPEILSAIILKLLKKNPDDRYQSAFGLKSDLAHCLSQLKKSGQIDQFPIAQYDHSIAIKIPEKLYGREKELRGLKEILNRVDHGSSELILIAGYAGTGKTVLVQELFRTMKGKGAIFIKGKAEQYRQGVPYTVISRAFHELVTYVLSKQEREFQSWKDTISTTLGDLGKVISDVVPHIELIIGKQKDVPQLRGQEGQNRFHYVFRRFLGCITARERPLVLFIDDLQWIDDASLNVLKMLSMDEELSGLLIIGAYRDNEVGETHPLQFALREIEREGVKVKKILLPNLKKSHIETFVSETLDTCTGTTELSSFLFKRTQGNPFFIKRYLLSLNEDNHITYNTIKQGWSWDIKAIRALRVSDNVVDMLVANIKTLNTRTQDILKLAACIGDHFRRSFLSVISLQSEDIIDSSLEDALSRQYLYRDGEVYYFVHDRIQQAALALMGSDQQKETHLQIGQLLLKITDDSDLGDSVFEIVNHLNFCVELLTDKKERKEVARLNLMAAQKARERAAFDSMLTYVNQGIDILLPDCWEKEYEITFGLYQEAVEAEYLNGNFERVDTRAEAVLNHARTMLDKIKTYEIFK